MHFEADGQACNDGTDWTGGDDLTHGGRYTTVRAIFPCSVAAPSLRWHALRRAMTSRG